MCQLIHICGCGRFERNSSVNRRENSGSSPPWNRVNMLNKMCVCSEKAQAPDLTGKLSGEISLLRSCLGAIACICLSSVTIKYISFYTQKVPHIFCKSLCEYHPLSTDILDVYILNNVTPTNQHTTELRPKATSGLQQDLHRGV